MQSALQVIVCLALASQFVAVPLGSKVEKLAPSSKGIDIEKHVSLSGGGSHGKSANSNDYASASHDGHIGSVGKDFKAEESVGFSGLAVKKQFAIKESAGIFGGLNKHVSEHTGGGKNGKVDVKSELKGGFEAHGQGSKSVGESLGGHLDRQVEVGTSVFGGLGSHLNKKIKAGKSIAGDIGGKFHENVNVGKSVVAGKVKGKAGLDVQKNIEVRKHLKGAIDINKNAAIGHNLDGAKKAELSGLSSVDKGFSAADKSGGVVRKVGGNAGLDIAGEVSKKVTWNSGLKTLG